MKESEFLTCPKCGSRDIRNITGHQYWSILQCNNCGFQQIYDVWIKMETRKRLVDLVSNSNIRDGNLIDTKSGVIAKITDYVYSNPNFSYLIMRDGDDYRVYILG